MRRYTIAIFVIGALFLVGCASVPFGKEEIRDDSFRCQNLGEGRGVVADFLQYAPPEEVREGRPFTLGITFANYFDDAITVDLKIQDTTDTDGFPEEGIEQSIMIDGSLVDNGIWYEPGCRLVEENGIAELSLGPYNYKPIPFDDVVQFRGTLAYDEKIEASFITCAFNPALGVVSGCATSESYGELDIKGRNIKAPIFLSDVEKIIIGSKEGATMKLDVTIRNAGGGYAGGDGTVDFSIGAEGMALECYSDSAKSSTKNGMSLAFDKETDEAVVHCETFLNLDRMQAFPVNIKLEYKYIYPVTSIPVKLKPGLSADDS